MMIFSLVAMIGLEKCCITSAFVQWLCHSGEQAVARGPLVSSIQSLWIRYSFPSGQRNNESYTLCFLDKRSIPDPHLLWQVFFFVNKRHIIHSSLLC